jgi:hypothetical protein
VAQDSAVKVGRGHSGGQKKASPGGSESVGHDSGEKIVAILGKKGSDLTDDDVAHMRKVVAM